MLLKLIPAETTIGFMRWRKIGFAFSALLILGSIALVAGRGLNLGIDFLGGTLIEVQTDGPADLSGMRADLNGLGLGEVALQEFGAPDTVLIRIQRQPGEEEAQRAALEVAKAAIDERVVEYRRQEFVGPTIGSELQEAAIYAVLSALAAIMIYIWFRFEWQFGLGAIVALTHDVIATMGLFALLQLEFNLSTVAAVLTIAGYSINDTVVVFDRVRENIRKYKRMPLAELFDGALNQTLSRTVMTSLTTLIALFALVFFGGEVIRGFSIALIWGIVIGTYSSVLVAVPLLLYLRPRRGDEEIAPGEGSGSGPQAAKG
ncbi:protein translocase subunit SecF [Marivibrio halodurans]|uniref:Protein-export membrane protein SecF n=1 Tax=Marivibrio halodurans TaxID=2039722 RepID=A0A8J7RWL1_9PROT|nr:protein translocase subunit SecF [Marivibrio halodurans]MBP5856052.1 protein translocase subunit SecF [Marivibrio halodurans]